MSCSNAAKMQNQLKFAGVPQTEEKKRKKERKKKKPQGKNIMVCPIP